MAAHQFGREELQVAALDADPADRVDIVAGPEAMGIARDPGVDPPAAAGAGLDLDRREIPSQLGEQVIGAQNLFTERWTFACRSKVAVVIPLEVADWQLVQQASEALVQIIAHLSPAHVQHQLVTRRDQRTASDLQRPVRVSTIELAVRIDHLRLDPEAEFHTKPGHVVSQRAKAVRILHIVRPPVAQAAGVVIATVEPAIVEHEAFDPGLGGGIGQVLQRSLVVIEIEAFPGVEVDRARAHRTAGPVHSRADRGVEVLRHAIGIGGAGREHFRRGQHLARGKPHFAGHQRLTQLPLPAAIFDPVDQLAMVARPGELRAIGRAIGMDHSPRHAIVRGQPAPVLAPPLAAGELVLDRHEFGIVPPGERPDPPGMVGQRQNRRGQPQHVERRIALVGQRGRDGQDITVRIERQGDSDRDPRDRIGQCNERPRAIPLHRTVGCLERPVPPGTVGLQSRLAKPALPQAGHQAERLIEFRREAGGRSVSAQWPRRRHAIGQARAPVAPQRRLVRHHFEHQAGGTAIENNPAIRLRQLRFPALP